MSRNPPRRLFALIALLLLLAWAGQIHAQSAPQAAPSPAAAGTSSAQAAPAASGDDPSSGADDLLAGFAANADDALALLRESTGRSDKEVQHRVDLMRDRLAHDRDLAKELADKGTVGARLVQAEIDALGPPPKDGEVEPPALADKRRELDDRLGTTMLPVLRWREAQARASALVDELDARSTQMRRTRLLERGRSPLDPRLWIAAVGDLRTGFSGPTQGPAVALARQGPGAVLGLLALALALLAAGPWLVYRLWERLRIRVEGRIIMTAAPLAKLGLALLLDAMSAVLVIVAVIIVLVAVGIAVAPLVGTGLLQSLAALLLLAGALLAAAQWLGRSVLLSPIRELRLVRFQAEPARRALDTVRLIGLVLALEAMLALFERTGHVGPSLDRLLSGLLVLAGSGLLWRLAQLIRWAPREERAAKEAAGQAAKRLEFAKPLSRVVAAFAFAAIVTALAGYIAMAREIYSSVLLSLAVVTVAVYFHRAVKLVFAQLAAGPLHAYRRALHLLPIASGLVLSLGVALLIAVIWGYRLQQVSDAVIALRTGVQFGGVNITAGDALTFVLVFAVGFTFTRWLQGFLRVAVLPEFGMDTGVQAALVTGLGYIGIVLAAVVAIASTGLDLSSLAFVAGALSVGIGFGLQSVVENFTSGLLLLIERPVKEGDWIVVGDNEGIVRKIAVRSTQIETFDGHFIIIPNSQLISGAVKNMTFTGGVARVVVEVGVAYGSDVEKVRDLLLDIARSDPLVVSDPEPKVWLLNFGDSSVDFRLMCWIDSAMGSGSARSNLRFLIARRFVEEGIEIPFPQRDIHIRTAAPPALAS